MTIEISRKQIASLAKALDIPGAGYLQKLDLIAEAFGFQNQAALMAVLNKGQDTKTPEVPNRLSDWRLPHDVGTQDVPIQRPVSVSCIANTDSIDVFIGGAEINPNGPRASTIRIEREGSDTRIMMYDSLCDAPYVVAITDGACLREAPNDWQVNPPQRRPEGDDLVVWPDGEWCRYRDLESFGFKSDDYLILPFESIPDGQEDKAAWAAVNEKMNVDDAEGIGEP